ncbi:hypothetical protein VTK56DRAFT_6285 [Thermocarpiscus australiensis]
MLRVNWENRIRLGARCSKGMQRQVGAEGRAGRNLEDEQVPLTDLGNGSNTLHYNGVRNPPALRHCRWQVRELCTVFRCMICRNITILTVGPVLTTPHIVPSPLQRADRGSPADAAGALFRAKS